MATILKIPDKQSKGIIVFTDIERDNLLKDRIQKIKLLKRNWILGLHHNYWYDFKFKYNPLYDFSIATKDDLKEINDIKFPMFEASVVNFNKDNFWKFNKENKHWDVLNIARNMKFKKNEEFIKVIRELYNKNIKIRVLMITYRDPDKKFKTRSLNDFYLENFNDSERQLFNLIQLDTLSPPFDFETLSFFYSNSKLFCSTSDVEHRPRLHSYAISSGIPIVVSKSISTLFPEKLRKEPGVFVAKTISEFSSQIIKALSYVNSAAYSKRSMQSFIDHFSNNVTINRFKEFILKNFKIELNSSKNTNFKNLDLRLARHLGFNDHLISGIPINIDAFLDLILQDNHEQLLSLIKRNDLERELSNTGILSSDNLMVKKPIINRIRSFLIENNLDKYPRKIQKYFDLKI